MAEVLDSHVAIQPSILKMIYTTNAVESLNGACARSSRLFARDFA
jgi:transposase-like protein